MSHITRNVDPRLGVMALMGSSAVLGGAMLAGGEAIANKIRNRNKRK
ncbi:hypothetical protein [Scytonema sp. NUACC26]